MEEYKSELLNEMDGGRAYFTDEEFARIKEYVERRSHATALAPAAPMENALAPSTSIGMFMPSTEVVRIWQLSYSVFVRGLV